MTKPVKTSWAMLFALALGMLTASAEIKLKIGDPAPPLNAAKWFKGQPVTAFDSNRVYVVEFWATWCGPCRKSIPHLTELAKKFAGRAQVIGFSIWEAEKTNHDKRLAAVDKFVSEMGDQMDYSIASDDNDGSMAKNWMEAAGEGGIPTAFIVGQGGRIAWIGHPQAGLDDALTRIIAGTFDTNVAVAAVAERQKAREIRAQYHEWLKPVTDLETDGQPQAALVELDKAVAVHSDLVGKVGYLRFKLFLAYDEPAAYRVARQLLTGELKNDASSLYSIARDLNYVRDRKTKDWDLAIAVAERSCELTRSANASYVSALAEARFGKGEIAKAVETEELAIKLAAADNSFPAGSKAYLERRLGTYKAALAKSVPAATP